jgi:FtsZ-binding cell division protein ZapB
MSTFEVVRGAEGDCLLLDDTRICGPKPWGGGTVTKTFHTNKAYAVVPKDELDKLKAENAELVRVLHELEQEAVHAYRCLQYDCETITGSASHYFDKWWHAECQNDRLKAENAKLREEIAKWERLAAGIDLPEYPVTQFKPKDLERENAKLRELVSRADTLMQDVLDNATDTVVVSDLPCCDTLFDNLCDYRLKMLELGFELSDTRIREMRELGIEVSS